MTSAFDVRIIHEADNSLGAMRIRDYSERLRARGNFALKVEVLKARPVVAVRKRNRR